MSLEINQVYCGDCFDYFHKINDGSVDLILTDPPYGTTKCKWDVSIPLTKMWVEFERIIKPNGAIVITGTQPFTSILVTSNLKMFRYDWYWEKEKGANFLFAN